MHLFSPLQMEDFDDSFTSCGGFGDIFGPNLDIPECQKDFQCVVGYNTDAVLFPQYVIELSGFYQPVEGW